MRAPIFTKDEIDSAARQAKRRNRLVRADKLAEIVGLEDADRQRLGIFTIGAIDKTRRERALARKQRKRFKDRVRSAIKRRTRGAISREEYLAESLSRSRPWEREGVSERTWYRRRGTSSSHPHRSLPSDEHLPTGREPPGSRGGRHGFSACQPISVSARNIPASS